MGMQAEDAGDTPRCTRRPRCLEPSTFAPGDWLADRYLVVRLIGRGGMGEVYECRDRLLGEPVAVKCARITQADDPTLLARLKAEVQLARKVMHPNVRRVHDMGLHTGQGGSTPFVTMELVAGETLAQTLARGAVHFGDAILLARQIAAAVAAVHDAGVIHG